MDAAEQRWEQSRAGGLKQEERREGAEDGYLELDELQNCEKQAFVEF